MSAFSVSEPFPTFHDRSGQPLEAGYLYFGTAGLPALSSPIPVYVDAALTIPAAQPVRTLNGFPQYAGAACRLYVDADDFSIAVHDSDNTLVFSSLNATVRIPLASTTGSITSDRVSYSEGETGATTRTLTSKLQESVSVFDFMTAAQIADVQAGTLLLDVTAPIAAALAAADEIYFPAGTYYVTNDGTATQGAVQIFNVTTGKVLRGAGRGATILRNMGSGPCITSLGNAIFSNVSVVIQDMTIWGQVGTKHGIFCDYTSQSIFDRLDLFQCGADGIKIQRGAHNVISDTWARSNTAAGISISGDAFFTSVQSVTCEANFDGLTIAIGTGTLSPRFTTIVGSAFRNSTGANANIGASRDVRFFGCSFETSASYTTSRHVSIDGGGSLASGVVLDACSLYGVNAGSTTVGVYAAACENATLSTSVVDCNGATAFNVLASATATQFLDNCAIIGTRTNASTSTVVRETQATPSPAVNVYTGMTTLPIRLQSPNGVNLIRFGDQRVWGHSDNNVYTLNSTPATATSGYVVGPGVETLTYANLPISPPVGTRVWCTDTNVAGWGNIVIGGGGAIANHIVWNGLNWTVYGH